MTKPQINGVSPITDLVEFNNDRNDVQTETSNFNANLFYLGIPFVGADSLSTSLSILAKQRIIIITGRYKGTEAQQKLFVEEIETEADKGGINSQPQRTYVNGINKTYYVRINSFTYTTSMQNPNHLDYTLELYSESN